MRFGVCVDWVCVYKSKNIYICYLFLWDPYSADSRHWADPGTFRGIWRRTQSSAYLAGRYPKAAPRIRSSRWGWWQSTPQSCVEWWRRWGRSEPAGSFYKRDFSAKVVEKIDVSWYRHWLKGGSTELRWGNPPALHCREWWKPWRRWFQPCESSALETGSKRANRQVFMFEWELWASDFCLISVIDKQVLTIAWWFQAVTKQRRKSVKDSDMNILGILNNEFLLCIVCACVSHCAIWQVCPNL